MDLKVKWNPANTLTYKPRKEKKNVITRMEKELSVGPFSLLHRSIKEHLKIRVWTRSFNHVRGICSGYLVAYDKHFNLALYDVDETYRNPKLLLPTKPSAKKKIKKRKRKKKKHQDDGTDNEEMSDTASLNPLLLETPGREQSPVQSDEAQTLLLKSQVDGAHDTDSSEQVLSDSNSDASDQEQMSPEIELFSTEEAFSYAGEQQLADSDVNAELFGPISSTTDEDSDNVSVEEGEVSSKGINSGNNLRSDDSEFEALMDSLNEEQEQGSSGTSRNVSPASREVSPASGNVSPASGKVSSGEVESSDELSGDELQAVIFKEEQEIQATSSESRSLSEGECSSSSTEQNPVEQSSSRAPLCDDDATRIAVSSKERERRFKPGRSPRRNVGTSARDKRESSQERMRRDELRGRRRAIEERRIQREVQERQRTREERHRRREHCGRHAVSRDSRRHDRDDRDAIHRRDKRTSRDERDTTRRERTARSDRSMSADRKHSDKHRRVGRGARADTRSTREFSPKYRGEIATARCDQPKQRRLSGSREKPNRTKPHDEPLRTDERARDRTKSKSKSIEDDEEDIMDSDDDRHAMSTSGSQSLEERHSVEHPPRRRTSGEHPPQRRTSGEHPPHVQRRTSVEHPPQRRTSGEHPSSQRRTSGENAPQRRTSGELEVKSHERPASKDSSSHGKRTYSRELRSQSVDRCVLDRRRKEDASRRLAADLRRREETDRMRATGSQDKGTRDDQSNAQMRARSLDRALTPEEQARRDGPERVRRSSSRERRDRVERTRRSSSRERVLSSRQHRRSRSRERRLREREERHRRRNDDIARHSHGHLRERRTSRDEQMRDGARARIGGDRRASRDDSARDRERTRRGIDRQKSKRSEDTSRHDRKSREFFKFGQSRDVVDTVADKGSAGVATTEQPPPPPPGFVCLPEDTRDSLHDAALVVVDEVSNSQAASVGYGANSGSEHSHSQPPLDFDGAVQRAETGATDFKSALQRDDTDSTVFVADGANVDYRTDTIASKEAAATAESHTKMDIDDAVADVTVCRSSVTKKASCSGSRRKRVQSAVDKSVRDVSKRAPAGEPSVLQRHVSQLFIRGDNVVMVALVT